MKSIESAILKMLKKHGNPEKVKNFYGESWLVQIIGDMNKSKYRNTVDRLYFTILEESEKNKNSENSENSESTEILEDTEKTENIENKSKPKPKRKYGDLVKLTFNARNTRLIKSVLFVSMDLKITEVSVVKHCGEYKFVRNVLYQKSFGINAFTHFKPFPIVFKNVKEAERKFESYVRKKRKTLHRHIVEDWDARHLIRNAPIDPKYLL